MFNCSNKKYNDQIDSDFKVMGDICINPFIFVKY